MWPIRTYKIRSHDKENVCLYFDNNDQKELPKSLVFSTTEIANQFLDILLRSKNEISNNLMVTEKQQDS